jgi:peptide/nickel transport system substrate-binding protein
MKAKNLFLVALLLVVAVVIAACGTAPEPAPAVQEQATESESESAAVEEAPEAAADEAEETAMEEESEAVEEDEPAVDESAAAKAGEVEGGTTVVGDEDVTTPRSSYGGDYRSVSTSDAVSFHPYQTTDTASSSYQAQVYTGGLLRLDEQTLEYIPNMAESYNISDDGLTFTFNLRQDMKWSDGEPITAQDFKWSYDQVINPDNGYPYISQLEFIESYEALDDYTLQIKITEVYAPALGQMSGLVTPLPKHIWQDLPWDDPEGNPEINSPSVVSGPYKLSEWKRDQYAIFEANDNYWYNGRPNIDQKIIEIVPDQDIAYQKLKSGESDTGSITPENLEEARSLDNITVYEWWPAAAVWSYIGLNTRDGFATSDVKVRQAINYAIDKQLITDEVMQGQAKRLCSIYPETSWVYNPDVPCYEYDPDKAIELMEEAGYTFQDGQMVDENGEQLTLKLLFGPNTSQTRELIALTTQDYLAEIGINVEIDALEWASFLEATDAEEPDWDMFVGGWRATIEPHIMYTIWAKENIPQLNSTAYINDEMESLFEEAGATYDVDFRKEKYGEVQRIIAEDVPYVFLFYNKSWSGQNNRVQGIEPTALGIGWNSEDWFIEETE